MLGGGWRPDHQAFVPTAAVGAGPLPRTARWASGLQGHLGSTPRASPTGQTPTQARGGPQPHGPSSWGLAAQPGLDGPAFPTQARSPPRQPGAGVGGTPCSALSRCPVPATTAAAAPRAAGSHFPSGHCSWAGLCPTPSLPSPPCFPLPSPALDSPDGHLGPGAISLAAPLLLGAQPTGDGVPRGSPDPLSSHPPHPFSLGGLVRTTYGRRPRSRQLPPSGLAPGLHLHSSISPAPPPGCLTAPSPTCPNPALDPSALSQWHQHHPADDVRGRGAVPVFLQSLTRSVVGKCWVWSVLCPERL